MTQRIEVPGMGVVEFPDGMTDEQITAAIQGAGGGQQQSVAPANRSVKPDDFWPVRLAKSLYQGVTSGVTLPGDVYAGRAKLPSSGAVPGSVPYGDPESAGTRVADLAMMASPVNPAVRAGDRAFPGIARAAQPAKPPVPTTQELHNAGAADLQAFRNSGLEVAGDSVSALSQRIQQKLFDDGIHPVDAPGTYKKLGELLDAPPGAVATAANLHSLRRSLGATARNFNPQAAQDQLAASRAIADLDGFISSLGSEGAVAGTPAAAPKLFERGRQNYAAAQRSNDITGELDRAVTGIAEQADLRAQVAHSGRNVDNTIRQKTAGVLTKPKEVSGFNDAEIEALFRVAEGGAGRNTARYVGNLLGGGGGLGQTLIGALSGGAGAGGGLMAGGPKGAILGAALGAMVPASIGAGSRSIANALARRDIKSVDSLVRQRSPLYEERVAEAGGRMPKDPAAKAALIRALLESLPQQ